MIIQGLGNGLWAIQLQDYKGEDWVIVNKIEKIAEYIYKLKVK